MKTTGWAPSSRTAALALAAGLHGLLVLGLIVAFTPAMVRQASLSMLSTFDVPTPPPPPAPPPVPASHARASAGAAGAAGRKAVPRILAVPPAMLSLSPSPAPPVAADGAALVAGAREAGAGSGAGASGHGPGNGAAGAGTGGGKRLVQTAGAIDSIGDYPPDPGHARIGKSVLIVFTVGIDGRVHDCRIRESSGDAAADAVTCRLAGERFRFRPSTDASGNPIPDIYGWRQRWFH